MLADHPEGVLVSVWVVPGASRDRVVGEHGGSLKVQTASPPEGGRANKAVARLVASALGGSKGTVVAGAHSRRKKVLVSGTTKGASAEAVARLERGR